jgi:hypothetical protein
MPKRSTPLQAIVRLVREHFAQPGVTVTESKMLRDAVLGIECEVDIVIEGEFDREPMVISIEVIERGRPATLEWVRGMLRKHRDLPTNRLLLVSKSGFTRNALAAVALEADRVQALVPEVIEVEGDALANRRFLDTIRYQATGCRLHIRVGETEWQAVEGEPLTEIYAPDGTLEWLLCNLVTFFIETVGRETLPLEAARKQPETDPWMPFSLGVGTGNIGYHIRSSDTGVLCPVEKVEILGDFTVSQDEILLTSTKLGGRVYGAAEVPIDGHRTIWVETVDPEKQRTTISWRTAATPGVSSPYRAGQTIEIPGLLIPSPRQAPSIRLNRAPTQQPNE